MTDGLTDILNAIGQAPVIVTLKQGAAASVSAREIESHFLSCAQEVGESLAAATSRLRGRSHAKASATIPMPAVRVYPRLGLAFGVVTKDAIAGLRADNRVSAVSPAPELSLIRPVAQSSVKAAAEPTWGLRRLRAPELWAGGYTGKGVVVGHLDTGIDGKHPALKDAIKSYAEFDLAGNRIADAKPRDSGEHGTHTAGTIAGRTVKDRTIGMAPESKLASAMVIEGGDVIARILGGMEWIIGEGATILSMSLGLRGFTPAFQPIVDALRAARVLPVFAVGNEYANTSRSPGNYHNVLSVGAIDDRDNVADFSSSQRFNRQVDPITPDIVAPGVDVISCVPGEGYATMDGTSMATPHVAGLAALLKQAAPQATDADIEAAILASCRRPASMSEERGNKGIPDGVAALSHLGVALPTKARTSKIAKVAKSPTSTKSVKGGRKRVA